MNVANQAWLRDRICDMYIKEHIKFRKGGIVVGVSDSVRCNTYFNFISSTSTGKTISVSSINHPI